MLGRSLFSFIWIFSARHYSESPKSSFSPIRYTLKKFSRFLPYVIIGTVIATIIFIVKYDLNFIESAKFLLYLPIQIMCLSLTGVMPGGNMEAGSVIISDSFTAPLVYDTPLWYLNALLIALPIVLYILYFCKNNFRQWLITYLPLLLYGMLIKNGNGIVEWYYGYNGLMRAIASLLFGCLIFEISGKISGIHFSNKRKMLLTIAECMGWIFVIGLSSITSTLYFIIEILAMVVLLSVAFGGCSYTRCMHCKVLDHLGKLTLPMYCIHYPIFGITELVWTELYWINKLIISVLITVFVSELIMWFVEKIKIVEVITIFLESLDEKSESNQ